MKAEGERLIVTIRRAQVEEMLAHAREARPAECCGLVGGDREGVGASVYRLRNIAADPRVAYDGDPQDLCEAQRAMRARGEDLLGDQQRSLVVIVGIGLHRHQIFLSSTRVVIVFINHG